LALVLVSAAFGQTVNWRKVGGYSVELMLASPATGPVDKVWFGNDGRLFARTRSGKVFETADFEIWTASANPAEPPGPVEVPAARTPETGVRVIGASFGRIYALGKNLFRSDDSGLSWNNLTAFKTDSVIGSGQHSVAAGPGDQVVVANDFGVWRSMDGGRSWTGLNQGLPNLSVKRILSAPQGTAGMRVAIENLGSVELKPGASVWQSAQDGTLEAEAARLKALSQRLGIDARSIAVAGQSVYVGTSDGRIRVSLDGGASFSDAAPVGSGPVERIAIDPARPHLALAVTGGAAGPHVLHTINSGGFWDPIDGNLPASAAHGVAADWESGAVYIASDRGVFWARRDLAVAGTAVPEWTSLNTGLQAASATDVMLDPAGVRIYAALDGYGVYAAGAPHRASSFRVVSSADFSTRPAAPGGLLSVIGGRVSAAGDGQLNYPVLAAADDASQIQVPFEAAGPTVTLALTTQGGRVPVGLRVLPVSPAIFVTHDGAPMLQDADSGLQIDPHNAAKSGARVQIFATGLGKVTPDWPTGIPAQLENPPAVTATIRAYLNGAAIPVTRATLAPGYIGFYQVEVQLPTLNNAGVNELYITAGGVESNRVPIVIEQ
jgi:uncharacterized protein (TIGR03437 family)